MLVDGGKIVHIASSIVMNYNLSLLKFMNIFPCLLVPPRTNTTNHFQIMDVLRLTFQNFPSLLKLLVQAKLLSTYSGSIQIFLLMILCFAAQLGYKKPKAFILSKNLEPALVDPQIIDKKLAKDLKSQRVEEVAKSISLLISSPLKLVPKYNKGQRKIHHLSHLVGCSVNDHIPDGVGEIRYTWFQDVLQIIIWAGKNCIILKRDIKAVFKNLPVAPYQQWLLGYI